MTVYALDTNTLTFLLKEDEKVNKNADKATNEGHELILPPIVDYEVQKGLLAKWMTKKLQEYLDFRQHIPIGVFDDGVWQKAAHVYASLNNKGINIDDVDILIGAYCLVNNYTLVTNNTRHFQHIDGLKHVDWKN